VPAGNPLLYAFPLENLPAMSLGLGQAFPQPGPRALRPAWRFRPAWRLRRGLRRRPPARLRLRWKRLLLVIGLTLLLLAAALTSWSGFRQESPFAGLLPADAPLVMEGETSAVLEALRRSPEPGPRILQDFGLSRALAGDTRRVMVAVFPGTPTPQAGLECQRQLTRVVEALETSWEKTQTWPASLQSGSQCPSGGSLTYRREGQDYVLECRGSDHHEVYDSRIGFVTDPETSPVLLVAIEKGEEPLQASILPGAHRDLRLFCNDQAQLNRLLSRPGPRLELPGPAGAPLRLTARARDLRAFFPGLPQTVPEEGRVEAWGDPTSGRLSLRLPLARPTDRPEPVQAAEMLAEMPQAPVVIAGDPSLMRWLGMDLPQVGTPRCLGLALADPLPHGQELQQVGRALSGRQAAVVKARFESPDQAREWLRRTPWSALLEDRPVGGEVTLQPEEATLRLGPALQPADSRPLLPAGPTEAELAGWATRVRPGEAVEQTRFCAGWDGDGLWIETDRQASEAEVQPEPPSIPTLQAR